LEEGLIALERALDFNHIVVANRASISEPSHWTAVAST
jgi:hypothetical protein